MAVEFEGGEIDFLSELSEALVDIPGASARELARYLEVTKRDVNRILYARPDLFFAEGDRPPRWYTAAAPLHESDPSAAAPEAVDAQTTHEGMVLHSTPTKAGRFDEALLHEWQREALEAWERNGRRGIVEAVTGAGKTVVALAAASRVLQDSGKVAVIVPKIELQRQWRAEVEKWLPRYAIGELGGSNRPPQSLMRADILIAVVNSASRYDLGLAGESGLLIADECHRAAAESFSQALEAGFAARLGLSATVERPDGLDRQVLLPYFDGIVYSLGFAAAMRSRVIAPVKLAHIATHFTQSDQEQHDEITKEIKVLWRELVNRWDVPSEPADDHFKAVNRLKTEQWFSKGGKIAGRYLKLIAQRKTLIAEAPAKAEALAALSPAILGADRVLVFTNTIDAARDVASRLVHAGVTAEPFHSELDKVERARLLRAFREGDVHVLAAPQVLDEGIDVPAADLGIILGASQSRRQMIQRMGRILRKKPDGRIARFALVYVSGTGEDPALGAHEAFLTELQEIAVDEQTFGLTADSMAEANRYLMDWAAPSTERS